MSIKGLNRNLPPFRAELVGSFLRPEQIRNGRKLYQQGEISKDELRVIENEEIIKLVEKQKAAGLQFVTDGEFRRAWWHLDFLEGLDGVTKYEITEGYQFHDVETKAETVYVSGKIDFTDHPMLEDFKFLKSIAGDHVAKMTIPSPNMLYMVGALIDSKYNANPIYETHAQLRADLAKAYKKAIQAFYDLGCRYLQLDDTCWGVFSDPTHRAAYEAQGIDMDVLCHDCVQLINDAIADRPADMYIGMHVCHGNFRSSWFSSGGYEPVSKILFSETQVDAFFLEYDTDRNGDFAPLRYVKNQFVVLGLITTKFAELENPDIVISRIEEATQYVDINHLCLSPQCGFASTEEGNQISEDDQWNKVNLVVDIAKRVWS